MGARHELDYIAKQAAQGAPDLSDAKLPRIEELLNTTDRVCVTSGGRSAFTNAVRTKADPPPYLDAGVFDLSEHTLRGVLERANVSSNDIGKFAFSSALPYGVTNLAGALETRLEIRHPSQPALAVDRRANCITSLVLTQNAVESMLLWRHRVALVGGVEKMSTLPLAVNSEWENCLINNQQIPGSGFWSLVKSIPWCNPFETQNPRNVITGLTMGQSCELMAKKYGIGALEQAEFAVASHRKAAVAEAKGYLAEEIIPFLGVKTDTMIRPDTDVAAIMRLKPSFRTPGVEEPTINAGTSSALTDGAAAAVLMTEEEAASRGAKPLAFILGFEESKVRDYNEEGLLMAPAYAIPRLLKRHGLSNADIDIFELHEPFAAQFLCVDKVAGPFPIEKVNPNGGAIAIGHPFGASGARYLYSTALELNRRSAELGRPVTAVIAVCANEGEGIAVLLKSA